MGAIGTGSYPPYGWGGDGYYVWPYQPPNSSVCTKCWSSPCTCWNQPTGGNWTFSGGCAIDYEKIREIVKEELRLIIIEKSLDGLVGDFMTMQEKAEKYDKLCEHFRESDLMDFPTEEEDEG